MKALKTSTVRSSPDDGGAGQDQALYRFLVDSLTEYAVFVVSPNGIVISWNSGAQKTFGYSETEIIGKSFSVIFTAEDTAAGAPQVELTTALSGKQTQHDRWHVRKDGTRFWGTNTVQPLFDSAGILLGFTKLVRDATVSHAALEELSDSEQQLRLLIESVADYAIFSTLLDGTISSWNSGAQKVFGYAQNEIVGRNFSILFPADDVAAGIPPAELRKATLHGVAAVEHWFVRKNGSRFLASGNLSELRRDAAGDSRGFVNVSHDITEHDAIAQELRRRAQYDELTALPNRRTFYEHVQRAISMVKRRSSHVFAVLFIDLDHFKAVNDEFGHIVADGLLAVTARRLEQCVRSEDVVARIGGDEFAILLNGIDSQADAIEAAERICIEMRAPATIDERDVRATVSVGIAIGHRRYKRPEDILRDADTAMYAAKAEGRARSLVFDQNMTTGGEAAPDVAAELHQALERGELRIAYQPIINLQTSAIAGFEALVRWEHPRRGLLCPSQFIPKAEESELIFEIDRWMLREATRQLATWQSHAIGADLRMSVNVSSKEFLRDEFLGELRRLVETSELPAANLRLEITETAMMEQSERVSELLAAIRALGIGLHIDDFGTGYSSLGALQRVAVDALKIDGSFVASIHARNGIELIETVITLAHKLGLTAIAEGIETAEQLACLMRLGCDYGQGFLFSPPMDAEAAGAFAVDAAK